jgi:hypothetical protein
VQRDELAAVHSITSSADEIRLANQADFVMGKVATVVSVDFSLEDDSAKLIGIDRHH